MTSPISTLRAEDSTFLYQYHELPNYVAWAINTTGALARGKVGKEHGDLGRPLIGGVISCSQKTGFMLEDRWRGECVG